MHKRKWIRVCSSNEYKKKLPPVVKRPNPSSKRQKTIGNAIPNVSKPSKRKRMNSQANWTN